jgi:hypothetical protein
MMKLYRWISSQTQYKTRWQRMPRDGIIPHWATIPAHTRRRLGVGFGVEIRVLKSKKKHGTKTAPG